MTTPTIRTHTTTHPKVGATILVTDPVRRTFVLHRTTTSHGGRAITYHGAGGETLFTRAGELVTVLTPEDRD